MIAKNVQPMVKIEGLAKTYGRLAALAPCQLDVRAGEVFGLLGPNGAGKTTLIRLLLGFLQPTAGQAWIDGFDCSSQSHEVHRRVAYLPGEVRLYRSLKGREVLRFFADLRGDGSADRAEKIAQRLQVDLERRVGACSSGMRQKFALATVFAARTPMLILDEPTTHLDPTARLEVLALVGEARREGRTVLFSSHVFSEVEDVCERAVMLRAGQVVCQQSIAELRNRHRISGLLTGTLEIPAGLRPLVVAVQHDAGRFTLETRGDLAPWFAWLSQQRISEVKIEPCGLREVYEQHHARAAGSWVQTA